MMRHGDDMKSDGAPKVAMTKEQYAQRIQVGRGVMDNLLKEGLPALRLGHRTLRIMPASADAWIARRFTTKH